MKTDQETNFVRSAIDPDISAGVMIANISWKSANTIVGTASPCAPNVVVAAVARPSQLRWPHRPFDGSGEVADAVPAAPNARVNPYSAHRMLTIPIVTNDIIIMFRVDLARVSPP